MAWKTIGVCYIFKLGAFGGGRLSGWFTTREGWMRLSSVVVFAERRGGKGNSPNRREKLRTVVCTLYLNWNAT